MNKRFYLVGVLLLLSALGVAYVLSGVGDTSPPATQAPADQGIKLN